MAENRNVQRPAGEPLISLPAALCAGGVIGGVVLAVAQFLKLYDTHIQSRHASIATGTVGSAHAYALLPVAVLAALLAYGVWRVLSRPALLGIGVLGAAALGISLLDDLPYAQEQGVKTIAGHYVLAANTPAIGLYVETLGAMVLIVTCVSGFILLGSPTRRSGGRGEQGHGADLSGAISPDG